MRSPASAARSEAGPSMGIELRREGEVFVLSLDDGENRFRDDSIAAWNEALDEVEATEGPKALVTTGTGKFYSNGLDLTRWGLICDQPLAEHQTVDLHLQDQEVVLRRCDDAQLFGRSGGRLHQRLVLLGTCPGKGSARDGEEHKQEKDRKQGSAERCNWPADHAAKPARRPSEWSVYRMALEPNHLHIPRSGVHRRIGTD